MIVPIECQEADMTKCEPEVTVEDVDPKAETEAQMEVSEPV